MPSRERVGDLPVVVALGSVDPDLVSGVLDGHCRFAATPGDGLAPRTQADILGRAVSEQWSRQQLETELGTWSARRQTRRYTYSTKEIR